jgi:hypothetical protein
MDKIVHFGIPMKLLTRGYKLTRENYAVISNRSSFGKNILYMKSLKNNNGLPTNIYSEKYTDKEGLIYTDDWCNKHMVKVMQNFDMNMVFYSQLDHVKFEREINHFLSNTNFVEISDLNNYSCPGYYAMVLDHYCQIYIGTTINIKKRVREHWGGSTLRFDRLIFGQISTSKLSINSFRALDTTRIFVYPTQYLYSQEYKNINFFSEEFISNRIGGGTMEFGELSVTANMKTRNLKNPDGTTIGWV